MMTRILSELAAVVRPLTQWVAERGVDFAIDLLAALVIFLIGALIIRLFSAFLRKTLSKRVGERVMLVNFAVSVVVKASWAVLAVVVLDKLGVAVGPLIAGLGVSGFILGFAFQESLGSLAAGLMIALNQPFVVGDYVSVAGQEGAVTQLDMMAVTLATGDHREITIPNKQVWGSPIVNYSKQKLRRVDVSVGIAYGADIAKARSVACATLKGIPGVQADPAPLAEVLSLGDSAVVLTCRAWVKNADYWPTFFAANRLVKEAFDANGIAIPFPQVDVHMV